MAEKLRLFVSATLDLESARAVIGRAIAELPVKVGVEIRRTPVQGASYEDIFELIANVDRVYFLLGRDITAPAGAEWDLTWKLDRSLMPMRAGVRRTQAAQEFARGQLIDWIHFRSYGQLARLVTLDLVRILNHPTNRYGLTIPEVEKLVQHGKRFVKATPVVVPGETGGAEGGGVLLQPVQGHDLEELFDDKFDDKFDDELLVQG